MSRYKKWIFKVKREWQTINRKWKIRVYLDMPHHKNFCIRIVQVSNSKIIIYIDIDRLYISIKIKYESPLDQKIIKQIQESNLKWKI